MSRSSDRVPSPGPSYARADPLRLHGSAVAPDGPLVRLGMAKPSIMDDGWWLTSGPSGAVTDPCNRTGSARA